VPLVSQAREGTVIAQHGRRVRVRTDCDDRVVVATCRSRLQWDGGKPAGGQVVVGDRVCLELRRDHGFVVRVHERRTSLMRAGKSGQPQVIAANVDQALVVLAAHEPEPRQSLLDRFLVACDLAGIEAVVTVNKIDLGTEQVEPWLPVYQELGYPVLRVSALTGAGIEHIAERLHGRTTLFCGQSGVGKSSLLNAVHPGFRLKVGSISESTGKGRHTTTRTELLPLPTSGYVVDTPGLKEFGLWHATRLQVQAAFTEIAERAGGCRFQDCTHSHEPECSVTDALATGEIDAIRYQSFRTMLTETIT
jgi:ribosome biogenesis GTPase